MLKNEFLSPTNIFNKSCTYVINMKIRYQTLSWFKQTYKKTRKKVHGTRKKRRLIIYERVHGISLSTRNPRKMAVSPPACLIQLFILPIKSCHELFGFNCIALPSTLISTHWIPKACGSYACEWRKKYSLYISLYHAYTILLLSRAFWNHWICHEWGYKTSLPISKPPIAQWKGMQGSPLATTTFTFEKVTLVPKSLTVRVKWLDWLGAYFPLFV